MSDLMNTKTSDEQNFRKYLLGDVSPQEQEELELWLMSDHEACDSLEAAEDELIDESLVGKLKGHDLEQFNNHFLAAPERRRKLQFARSLHRFIEGSTQSDAPPVSEMAATVAVSPSHGPLSQPSEVKGSFWHTVSDFLRSRPAFQYAVSALVVLIAAGSVWSVFRTAHLQRELDAATDRITQTVRERDEIKRQLDEKQSLAERLSAQVEALEETVKGMRASPTSQTLLAFNLIPGTVRSSSEIQRIAIPANARLVQFSLILLDDNYDSYRAVLLNDDGKELWTRDGIAATATRDGKAVVLTVPADLLPNGDLRFSLWGVSDSRPPESINTFNFHVVRQ
jgi:hypothetical protein